MSNNEKYRSFDYTNRKHMLYSDDRKAEDYDLLIAFIKRVYEKEKPSEA